MEFVKNPEKSKKVFILMLVLSIFFFLVSSTLGYLFYQKYKNYNNLENEKNSLENQLSAYTKGYQSQSKDLLTDLSNLQKENQTYKKQIADNNAKSAKIKAYNDVLDYIIQVIDDHDGLIGITDSEYQTCLEKARLTDDTTFTDLIDWAWHHEEINQIERLIKVLDYIATKIDTNTK